jgi:hypothetical protein
MTSLGGVHSIHRRQTLPGVCFTRLVGSTDDRDRSAAFAPKATTIPFQPTFSNLSDHHQIELVRFCWFPMNATVSGIDIMPTIFDLAGAATPRNWIFDGTILMPLFEGGGLKERSLFWMDSSVGPKFKLGDTPQSRSKAIRKGP